MSTLDSAVPSVAESKRFSSSISSCNSLNKPRSSTVIALYKLRRFTDHCEDAHDVADDDDLDPDLVGEDDLDPECDLDHEPASTNDVIESSTAPSCREAS